MYENVSKSIMYFYLCVMDRTRPDDIPVFLGYLRTADELWLETHLSIHSSHMCACSMLVHILMEHALDCTYMYAGSSTIILFVKDHRNMYANAVYLNCACTGV